MNYFKNYDFFKKAAKIFRNSKWNSKCVKKFTYNSCFNSKNYCSANASVKEVPALLTYETLEKLSKNIPSIEKKIKLITLEIENLKLKGFDFPEFISEKDWLKIVERTKYSERLKVYNSLSRQKLKRIQHQQNLMSYEADLKKINLPNHLEYRLGKNCNLLRVSPTQINKLLNLRLYTAQLFSNDIVIDMGYEHYMNEQQLYDCAMQLRTAILQNRMNECPFNIHLCNYPKDTRLSDCVNSVLHEGIHNLPINIHNGSYLDVFERDRLVYLSPDAKLYLKEYNPNSVYIIGGFVDFDMSLPVSVKKAKMNNVKAVKLPLEQHLDWKKGSKSFAINVVLKVMSDLQYYRDWKVAFTNLSEKVHGDNPKEFDIKSRKVEKEGKR